MSLGWDYTCESFLNKKSNKIDYIWIGNLIQMWGSAGIERNATSKEIAAQNTAGDFAGVTFHGLEYTFLRKEDDITYYKAHGKVALVYNAHDFTLVVFGKDSVETGGNCRYVLDYAKSWLNGNGYH
ncbi:uncharacterized protein LOC143452170 [Clavelina lepadiformis]|uniref:uncharacterized protein LOC143452170 n=1 Tax=Clavelina lepadiformis TaxID=159417 RepID=UPI004041BF3D